MLEALVRRHAVDYFFSPHWQDFVKELERGDEVRHAHIYVDSILPPEAIARLVRTYFEAAGRPLQRQIRFLSHGRGFANVYNVHPAGMCHFEVMVRFNDQVVLEPMPPELTREGRNAEYWDDAFMERFYDQFTFRPMGREEEEEVRAYFRSDAWKSGYACMTYEDRNVHSHNIVETSLHPEDILPLGLEAIRARGWDVGKAVSVVFNVRGADIGKITYLLSRPEIVLELEWEYNPHVIIRPAVEPISRIIHERDVRRDLDGIPYFPLRDVDVEWAVEEIRRRLR